MIRVVGLGAGGHSRVVIETLRLMDKYCIVGLLDPNPRLWNSRVLGVPVLGDDDLLSDLFQDGVRHAFIGLGSVGDSSPRKRLYELALRQGFQMVSAIHPQAVVSPSAELGHGVTVMASAVINAGARVGDNVVINTASVVEHDCIIGDHVHVATGARLASTVCVGDGAHIGAGATVIQSVTIGQWAVVGAGAVVVRDVPEHATVIGVPARPLSKKSMNAGQ